MTTVQRMLDYMAGHDEPITVPELGRALDAVYGTVGNAMRRLHAARVVHIAEWDLSIKEKLVPCWVLGPGKDAPRPTPNMMRLIVAQRSKG